MRGHWTIIYICNFVPKLLKHAFSFVGLKTLGTLIQIDNYTGYFNFKMSQPFTNNFNLKNE